MDLKKKLKDEMRSSFILTIHPEVEWQKMYEEMKKEIHERWDEIVTLDFGVWMHGRLVRNSCKKCETKIDWNFSNQLFQQSIWKEMMPVKNNWNLILMSRNRDG